MNYGTIDISLTSISSRMDTLPQTLQSLLDQSYGDLRIHLHLSREAYLLDDGVPNLPEPIAAMVQASDGRLNVVYTRNIGPFRKLLPFLRANWGRSKLVATADDDTIYPQDWLQGLVEAYHVYGCVIAYRGHRILVQNGKIAPYRSWMRNKIEENPSRMILPTGKDGILYDTAFFPVSVLNIDDALVLAPTADDLWFRWNLSLNGIYTHVINTDYASGTFEETEYDSSLYLNFNMGGGNDDAIARLGDYFQQRFGFDIVGLAA